LRHLLMSGRERTQSDITALFWRTWHSLMRNKFSLT
jgi:hypothetical protein